MILDSRLLGFVVAHRFVIRLPNDPELIDRLVRVTFVE